MSPSSDALCAAHPDVPATAVCRRCGSFLCASCSRPYEKDVLCGDCYTRHVWKPEVSTLAGVAFWLGIAGLVAGLVPGVAAWVLAELELRSIARGDSPPGGRTYAAAARVVGMVCTGTLAVVGLAALNWALTH